MARIETREDLIIRLAEWLAYDDKAGYYYHNDIIAAWHVGDTEIEIASEWASQLKRHGRIIG